MNSSKYSALGVDVSKKGVEALKASSFGELTPNTPHFSLIVLLLTSTCLN
jgi:hypothetical protein